MKFELTILGNTSPFPSKGRLPTSQVLNFNERLYLIDCGEGTQIRLNELGIKRMKIDRIFISHLHGDHYFGLFGLLGSFRVLRRPTPLHIHAPAGLKELIEQIESLSGAGDFPFPIHFHINHPDESALIFENKELEIHTIPLSHRIPATGFLFQQKPLPRKMIKEKIKEYNIPYQQISMIKNGADFKTDTGKIIKNDELTLPPPPSKSYAFCSDTMYHPPIVPLIKGVDLLYHETTFTAADGDNAALKGHSTTLEAAQIAKAAEAKKLLIGHFSTRYNDSELEQLAEEARTIFENTEVGMEKRTFKV